MDFHIPGQILLLCTVCGPSSSSVPCKPHPSSLFWIEFTCQTRVKRHCSEQLYSDFLCLTYTLGFPPVFLLQTCSLWLVKDTGLQPRSEAGTCLCDRILAAADHKSSPACGKASKAFEFLTALLLSLKKLSVSARRGCQNQAGGEDAWDKELWLPTSRAMSWF